MIIGSFDWEVSRTFQIGMDFFEEGEGEGEVGRQAHHSN